MGPSRVRPRHIASGAPVPLKGAAVLRVTLLEGRTPEEARAGPEIFVRCKLILGGRALDCASRMGLGFRPGPEHHILDTLSIRIPRARTTPVSGRTAPTLSRRGCRRWTGPAASGAAEGFVLLAAQELDHTLEPGDVVAEVRSGLVETAACDCGAVETNFLSVGEDGPCETCGVAKAPESSDGCFSCGSFERTAVRSYQGCSSCSRTRGRRSASTRVGVFSVLAAVSALFAGGSYERPVEDSDVVTFLGNIPKEDSWWDAPGGVASVWGRRPKADELSSPSVKDQPLRDLPAAAVRRSLAPVGHSGPPQRPERGAQWVCSGHRASRGLQDAARPEVGRLGQGLCDERAEGFSCGS